MAASYTHTKCAGKMVYSTSLEDLLSLYLPNYVWSVHIIYSLKAYRIMKDSKE